MRSQLPLALAWLLFTIPPPVSAQLRDVTVTAATRLDWAFAAQGFGAEAAKIPAGYDSTAQRYQLFVPATLEKDKPAALVVFISSGPLPMGITSWKALCEKNGMLFCSPFAAGNGVPAGQRTRIVLDMVDDVRRSYRIDPNATYVSGFSGGARMACSIGFALPEAFAGIVPICGTNPLAGPTYLRHRARDRLSVAFVTGEKDFNRKENEVYMAPWLEELGIRTKLWVVPKMGHAVPSSAVLAEVHAWLQADLKRREADTKLRPGLSLTSEQTPTGPEQARQHVESAQLDLLDPDRTWRGVALLQGVVARWGKTLAGSQARALLKDIVRDDKLAERIAAQGADDEIKSVSAQAKALERFGLTAKAIEAWSILAQNYEGMSAGQNALAQIRRLRRDKE